MTNPWHNLAENEFICPGDRETVLKFNQGRAEDHRYRLHFDIVPEAFIGARDAPVVLFSNNPGYSTGQLGARSTDPFQKMMRANLRHKESDCPFVFLRPEIEDADYGKKWWRSKLRDLIIEFDESIVARSILNIVYFPYASNRFGHLGLTVPSQAYSFHLVRNAIERNAVIVRMRTGTAVWEQWLEAVPELKGYKRLHNVSNPQAASVNRGNLSEQAYDDICEAIRGYVAN